MTPLQQHIKKMAGQLTMDQIQKMALLDSAGDIITFDDAVAEPTKVCTIIGNFSEDSTVDYSSPDIVISNPMEDSASTQGDD